MEEIVKPELETRIIPDADSEIRAIGKTRMVEGYAIVFNSESRDLGGFKEVILPEAIDGIIERSDVLALMNHDVTRGLLARSTNGKGSLELIPDQKGVVYRFTAPDTTLGNELIEGLKRGDIRTSSFAFSVDKDGQTWNTKVKPAIRTITKFRDLYDVSAVYREAYEDTTVALRSFNEVSVTEIPVEEPIVDNSNPVIEEPIIRTMEEPKPVQKRVISKHEAELRKRNELFKQGNYLTIKRLLK